MCVLILGEVKITPYDENVTFVISKNAVLGLITPSLKNSPIFDIGLDICFLHAVDPKHGNEFELKNVH